MHRLCASLVILAATAMVACGPPDIPRKLAIETGCGADNYQVITEAIEVWNAAGREYVGQELIDPQGFYTDEDGLQIDSDLHDGRNVLYCVNDPALFEVFKGEGGPGTAGTTFGEDIVLYPFKIVDKTTGQVTLDGVREVTMHELGHFLGFPHSPDQESIMYWRHIDGRYKTGLAPSDLQNLCIIYDCVKQP